MYINDPGHMTKMAAMPIYGKNPSKILRQGQHRLPMPLNGDNCYLSVEGKDLQEIGKWTGY